MFDVQLTRTGAMMGTPAYMAPEQFLGTPTDARTDQFSFCVALYEALYGERPFAGNTMYALTNNVVQGKVRDAPVNASVPLWIRKILLRGMRATGGERFPSMGDLLDALAKNPATMRRKVAVAVAGALLPVVLVFGIKQSMADHRALCGGGQARLAGAWELWNPGEPEPARHVRIKNAFLKTGKSYAADVHATVSRVLTGYAQGWANMYQEACEATHIHQEQSIEVLDLRMACLHERLGGLRALTDVFTDANGDVVENAVSAANALGSLDRCADVALLRSVVRPPEDPATRAKVADLRHRLATLKARVGRGPLDGGAEGDAGRRGRGARARLPAAGRGDPAAGRAGVRALERREGGGEDAAPGVLGGGRGAPRRRSRHGRDRDRVRVRLPGGHVPGGRALVGNGGGGAAAAGRARADALVAAEQHRRGARPDG